MTGVQRAFYNEKISTEEGIVPFLCFLAEPGVLRRGVIGKRCGSHHVESISLDVRDIQHHNY